MTVAEPFRRGGAQTYDWAQIAEHQHAHLVIDRLVAVDCAEHTAFTHGGARLRYDVMALATRRAPRRAARRRSSCSVRPRATPVVPMLDALGIELVTDALVPPGSRVRALGARAVGKVAGRYLAPYLATARPPSIGASPLSERVPTVAGGPGVAAAHALKPERRGPLRGRTVKDAGVAASAP